MMAVAEQWGGREMDVNEAVARINGALPVVAPSKPINAFADRTRKVVDDIVTNVTEEFTREIAELRRELDDFEKLLIAKAALTKGSMNSYVDLVLAGHDLTRHVHDRIQVMRAAQEEILAHDMLEERHG
jgi:hypothetical protein